jgi:hypothetical protein
MSTATHSTTIERRIRYNPATDRYDCFLIVGGVEHTIGACPTSDDAETHCAATAHALRTDAPTTVAQHAYALLSAHLHAPAEASDAAVYDARDATPSDARDATPSDARDATPPPPPVVIAHDDDEALTSYTCGDVELVLAADAPSGLLTLFGGDHAFDAAGSADLRNLARILHHRSAQNDLGLLWEPGTLPTDLHLAALQPGYATAFDNACLNEEQERLYGALTRMGLTQEQRADVMGHVAQVCGTVASQAQTTAYRRGALDGRLAMCERFGAWAQGYADRVRETMEQA